MRLRKCEFSEFLATAVSIKLVKGVAPLPPGASVIGPTFSRRATALIAQPIGGGKMRELNVRLILCFALLLLRQP